MVRSEIHPFNAILRPTSHFTKALHCGLVTTVSNPAIPTKNPPEMLYASELEMISSDESIVLGQDSPEQETVAGGSDQTCQM